MINPATFGDDFRIGTDNDEILLGYPNEVDSERVDPKDETGDDRIYGRGGTDAIGGGGGNDTLYGDDGTDTVVGSDGQDRVVGGHGNDLVLGEAGDDLVVGGDGNDSVAGGGGDDAVYGGEGNDLIFGGVDLPAELDNDPDTSGGRDRLYGGNGNDYLFGGNGNDFLNGGAGRDWLRGGQGADKFAFRGDWGADRVADYQDARDILDFSGNGLAFADLNFTQVGDNVLIAVGAAGFGTVELFDTLVAELEPGDFLF